MVSPQPAHLLLVRHAPSHGAAHLAGRRDIAAQLPPPPSPARHISSPALRCRQTAEALLPGAGFTQDARLWEQDFGAWEGLETASLPDLGPLSRAELACHRPPGGESFLDVCHRATPALQGIAADGPALVITHAGVIRAALGLALGDLAQGLAFKLAPLSATRLTYMAGAWSIGFVNIALAP